MAGLAASLRAAYEADPGNASLAREYRMTLQALSPGGQQIDPELAEFLRGFRDA